jgi:hypothetical protein
MRTIIHTRRPERGLVAQVDSSQSSTARTAVPSGSSPGYPGGSRHNDCWRSQLAVTFQARACSQAARPQHAVPPRVGGLGARREYCLCQRRFGALEKLP